MGSLANSFTVPDGIVKEEERLIPLYSVPFLWVMRSDCEQSVLTPYSFEVIPTPIYEGTDLSPYSSSVSRKAETLNLWLMKLGKLEDDSFFHGGWAMRSLCLSLLPELRTLSWTRWNSEPLPIYEWTNCKRRIKTNETSLIYWTFTGEERQRKELVKPEGTWREWNPGESIH